MRLVESLEIESDARLGIDQPLGAAHRQRVEIGALAGFHRRQVSGIDGSIDLAKGVVREALGEIRDASAVPCLIAVGDLGRRLDLMIVHGRVEAIIERLVATRLLKFRVPGPERTLGIR